MRNGNSHWYSLDSSWVDGKRQSLHELGETARGYGASLTEQIKAHPLAAAGAAFAIGYVLMRLARR